MGSRTLVHAAVGSDGENWKGEYLSDCRNDEYTSFKVGLMKVRV